MIIYDAIFVIFVFAIIFGIYKVLKTLKTKNNIDLKDHLSQTDIENEKTVRKKWLIAFYVYITASILTIICILKYKVLNAESEKNAFVFGFTTGPLFIWALITYYCVYKKRGTAWLMFSLIVLPFRELQNLVGLYYLLAAEFGIFGILVISPLVAIAVYYLINCKRLLSVNSSREYKALLALKKNFGPDACVFDQS